MTPDISDVTLHYFGIEGLGEALRLTMLKGNIEFNDERYNGEKWGAVKSNPEEFAKFPCGQLPLLEFTHKGNKSALCQSGAALKFLGAQTGAYPKDDLFLAAKVDEIIGAVEDIRRKIYPTMMESDETKRAEMRKELNEKGLPQTMANLEGLLAANQKAIEGSKLGFAVGDFRSIADFNVAVIVRWVGRGILDGVDPKTVVDSSKYKHIMAICAAINDDAEVKAFREKCGLPTEVGEGA